MVCAEYKGQYITLIPLSNNYAKGQHRTATTLYCLSILPSICQYAIFKDFQRDKSLGKKNFCFNVVNKYYRNFAVRSQKNTISLNKEATFNAGGKIIKVWR